MRVHRWVLVPVFPGYCRHRRAAWSRVACFCKQGGGVERMASKHSTAGQVPGPALFRCLWIVSDRLVLNRKDSPPKKGEDIWKSIEHNRRVNGCLLLLVQFIRSAEVHLERCHSTGLLDCKQRGTSTRGRAWRTGEKKHIISIRRFWNPDQLQYVSWFIPSGNGSSFKYINQVNSLYDGHSRTTGCGLKRHSSELSRTPVLS